AAALAADVLDAVADNRPIVVSPTKAVPLWLFYRFSPRLFMDLATRRGPLSPSTAVAERVALR
ncbi:MAG TPA: hypothetical protein VEJ44_06975, partial [Acidimicrobiales bacterium]|nr:hypothetical protein [Acidimicrobiales bacterium]